jgi:hypothetical protein
MIAALLVALSCVVTCQDPPTCAILRINWLQTVNPQLTPPQICWGDAPLALTHCNIYPASACIGPQPICDEIGQDTGYRCGTDIYPPVGVDTYVRPTGARDGDWDSGCIPWPAPTP